jgi:hypothetical protein
VKRVVAVFIARGIECFLSLLHFFADLLQLVTGLLATAIATTAI